MPIRPIAIGYVAAAFCGIGIAGAFGWLAGVLVVWVGGPCLGLLIAYVMFRRRRWQEARRCRSGAAPSCEPDRGGPNGGGWDGGGRGGGGRDGGRDGGAAPRTRTADVAG